MEPKAYAPQPEDQSLSRAAAFVDSVEGPTSAGLPAIAEITIKGFVPTPCHRLRLIASSPDEQKHVQIQAYSVVKRDQMCAQVLTAFSVSLPLTNLAGGEYIIDVNQTEMLRFQWPVE